MKVHPAILKGDFLQARKLIESGAKVNDRDEEWRTPLMLCCLHDGESWALGVARMLLVNGAQVGLCDSQGRSALIYAVLYERLELIKVYLGAMDFDLNSPDKFGHTALWYAAQIGNSSVYELLLRTVKRYGLIVALSPSTAPGGSNSCQDGQRGRAGHGRVVKQKVLNYTINHEFKGLFCSEPAQLKSLLFKKDLPYKAVPANVWAKRETIYKRLKQSEPNNPKPGAKKNFNEHANREKVPTVRETPTSLPMDWKVNMQNLMEALQCQLSSSYRPRAQPRHSAQMRRRRTPRLGPSPTVEALLHQSKQRGRKMSLDAIDDNLLKERAYLGAFRRRCSVAVIPMIRLSRRGSVKGTEVKGGEHGEGKIKRGDDGTLTPRPLGKIEELHNKK